MAMEPAIGLVETNSIAAGIETGDAMMKKALWSCWRLARYVPASTSSSWAG